MSDAHVVLWRNMYDASGAERLREEGARVFTVQQFASADGIRCKAVASGWIDTDLNIDFIDGMPEPAAFRREIGRIHPIGRPASPVRLPRSSSFLPRRRAAS
jgi:NAD(P)-dependent dehydrogenase (short-subunit alcohol dehydrogenase family)